MQKIKPELIFTIVIMIAGIANAFLTPIGAGFDEETHVARIYEIANLHFIPNELLSKGARIPQVFFDLSYRQAKIIQPIPFDFWFGLLDKKMDFNQLVRHETRSVYFPALYLPPAFIMGLFGRILKMPVPVIYFFMRLSYLALYAFMTYWAIRIVPFGKWVLGILSISPMAIVQASTVTPDAVHNASCFLFIGGVLALSKEKDKKFTRLQFWALVSLIIILTMQKVNGIPLLFLLLLIPRQKFGNKKRLWGFIALTLLAVTIFFVGWNVIASGGLNSISSANSANPSGQLQFIMHHPLELFNVFWITMQSKGQNYLVEWIGVTGYGYFRMPTYLYYLYIAMALLSLLIGNYDKQLDIKKRSILFTTFLLVSLFTIFIFYVTFSPIANSYVKGVQGRYFIGAVPLLFLALIPPFKPHKSVLFTILGLVLISMVSFIGTISLVYHVTCGNSYYESGLCNLPKYKNWDTSQSLSSQITGNIHFKQTFVVQCNNLNEVRFWIKNNGTYIDQSIVARISEVDSQKLIAEQEFQQSVLPPEGWLTVNFPTINDSLWKTLEIEIEPGSSARPQDIEIALFPKDEYPYGILTINSETQTGDLIFQYGCIQGLEQLKMDN